MTQKELPDRFKNNPELLTKCINHINWLSLPQTQLCLSMFKNRLKVIENRLAVSSINPKVEDIEVRVIAIELAELRIFINLIDNVETFIDETTR
jgi:hypothetical protein